MVNLKHEDVLRAIEAERTWNNAAFTCSICYFKDVDYSCEVPGGRVCVACAKAALNEANAKLDISGWPLSKFLAALSPKGRLRYRLLVLGRFPEIQPKITTNEELNQFYSLLVDNLGYITTHPLAHSVRKNAMTRCLNAGKLLLPMILEKVKSSPWEFYANIVYAAVKIDHSNPKVKKLMQKATAHSNPGVREKLVFALSSISDLDAFDLLTKLKNDPNFHVRTLARQAISDLNRKKLTDNQPSRRSGKLRTNRSPVAPVRPKRPEVQIAANDPVMQVVEKEYKINDLRKLYKEYLYEFIPYEKFGLPDTASSISSMRKEDLAVALKTVLESKEIFLSFFSRIPEGVQKVLSMVIWLGGAHEVGVLEEIFGIKVYLKKGFSNQEVLPACYLCACQDFYHYGSEDRVFLYMPNRFRKIIKEYLHLPEFAKLQPKSETPRAEILYANDVQVIEQIFNLFRYVQTGNIKFSKNGNKILSASIKELREHFSLKEFFNSSKKELTDISLHILINFLLKCRIKPPDTAMALFKKLFGELFVNPKETQYFLFSTLADHLKGGGTYLSNFKSELRYRKSLHNILKSLPVGQWIDFNNLKTHLMCHDYFINPITFETAFYDIHFKYRSGSDSRYRYFEKIRVGPENYVEAVIDPLLKGSLFLFAAFGMLDLAYDYPWTGEKDKSFLTPYDGLWAIRLTELGAFALGKNTDFQPKIIKHEVKVTLDEKHLIVYLEGVDPVKSMLLEKIAEPINPACFKVSFQSFLKGCTQQKDIENKFTFFKQHVSGKPPENWHKFLESVRKKMNPLTVETSVAVFKIEAERELIELISRDEILREKIIKAENFRIIVETKNLKTVKKRLEEFGYFIDNW